MLSETTSVNAPHERSLICGVLASSLFPTLLFLMLLLHHLKKSGASPVLSVLYISAAVPFSFIGLYGSAYFGHILGGTLLVLGWRASDSSTGCSVFFSGAFCSLAGAAEFPLLVFLPFFFFFYLFQSGVLRFRKSLLFILGSMIGVSMILIHNFFTTGHLFEFAYKYVENPEFSHMKELYGFRAPSLNSLWGLLFSPSRGLFFYAPVVLFSVRSIIAAGKGDLRHLALFAFLLLMSSYAMWDGGWSLGPRHLIPLAMVLIFLGASSIPRHNSKPWLFSLGSCVTLGSVLIPAAKSTVLYMVPPNIKLPLTDLLISKILAGEFNPNTLGTWLLGWTPGWSHLCWVTGLILGTLGFVFWANTEEKKAATSE